MTIYKYVYMKRYFLKAELLIKIGTSLYIIATSVYDISEDLTEIKKEHGLLLIGLISLVKAAMEVKKKITEVRLEVKEF
ncbi:MAG: hypothetical protein K0S32_1566 [Bacteroidetes bacterium]|nr:hypothetical protein [Bacteroidota bacterium]